MDEEIKPELKGRTATELREMLIAKSDAFEAFVAPKRFEKDGVASWNLTMAEAETMRAMNNELTDIGKALDVALETDQIIAQQKARRDSMVKEPAARMPHHTPVDADSKRGEPARAVKSLGHCVTESDEWREAVKRGEFKRGHGIHWGVELKDFEFKTTMTTAAGFAPANDRTSIVIPSAQRRPVIQDYIPQMSTTLDAIKFMEETTFTNSADATAEGSALGESALAYTERTTPVELIGTFLPVTEQQLEIEEAIRGVIDNRLMLMLMLEEEAEILNGDASTPNLVGFYNKSGIQTQAKGSDSSPDAIYKAFQKLRGASGSGFVEPSLVVIHPDDWTDIRLLKDGNGNYIWGNPAEAGIERIWGKPVVQTTAATENSALTGDFSLHSEIWRKRGARIDAGYQNDDFVKNKVTLKITSRLCLVIHRAAAFATVTGL